MFNIISKLRSKTDSARGRSRARSGFTLVELAVVASITTVLLVLIIRWVLSLLSATQVGSASYSASRDMTLVSAVFASDASSARGCSVSGSDGAIESYSSEEISFFVDVTGPTGSPDMLPDLVSWRLLNSRIQRSVTDGSLEARCVFSATPNWLTVAERVRAAKDSFGASLPVFSLLRAGEVLDVAQTTGSCLLGRVSNCLSDTVRLHLIAETVTGAASSEILANAQLFSNTSRIT